MLLPERLVMERREVRDAERVSGTGAMMAAALGVWYVCGICVELWNEAVRQRLCFDVWSLSFGVEERV